MEARPLPYAQWMVPPAIPIGATDSTGFTPKTTMATKTLPQGCCRQSRLICEGCPRQLQRPHGMQWATQALLQELPQATKTLLLVLLQVPMVNLYPANAETNWCYIQTYVHRLVRLHLEERSPAVLIVHCLWSSFNRGRNPKTTVKIE